MHLASFTGNPTEGTTGFSMEGSGSTVPPIEGTTGPPMEGTTGFSTEGSGSTGPPMEGSTGPPMEGSGNDMEDYEDSTPFQCNDQNLPGGSDKPSSKVRSKSVNSLPRYKL